MRQVVLLATQRSGTNMLRRVLGSHSRVQVFPEIFHDNPAPRDLMPATAPRYFDYLRRLFGHGSTMPMPAANAGHVSDYLDCLAGFAGPDHCVQVLDIKYNSLHHANDAWQPPSEPPRALHILGTRKIPVLHLVRMDVVAICFSQFRAEASGVFVAHRTREVEPVRFRCDPKRFLHRLRRTRADRALVEDWLRRCGIELLEIHYEALFRGPPGSHIDPARLQEIGGFLGIDPSVLDPRPQTRKLSPSSLRQELENFDEILEFLEGTEFHGAMVEHR